MTSSDLWNLGIGAAIEGGAAVAFVLALFLGFCILFGFSKVRATAGRNSTMFKSLDERVGKEQSAKYFPPDAPRGPVDVLHAGQYK